MTDFTADSHGIKVRVRPLFLSDQSSPIQGIFTWSYEVDITNTREKTVSLSRRYWLIKDLQGRHEEVEGPGVVGLQPAIAPGETFTYSSFCVLPTTDGTMQGHFVMTDEGSSEPFEAKIPEFVLTYPGHDPNEEKPTFH